MILIVFCNHEMREIHRPFFGSCYYTCPSCGAEWFCHNATPRKSIGETEYFDTGKAE